MSYTERVLSLQRAVFNAVEAVQRAEWDALLDASIDPHMLGYKSADRILDQLGFTELQLAGRTSLLWQPQSPAVVRVMTATGAVVKRRFVRLVAPNLVAAMTVAGDPYQGIALNDAADGEPVYVMFVGVYPVETSLTPPMIGQPAASDASGRTVETISGDYYTGTVVSQVFALGAANYQLVSLAGVSRQSPFLVEFMPNPRMVVESDVGVTQPFGSVTNWADESPNNNNPQQPFGPSQWQYINDGTGPNGKPFMRGSFAASRFMFVTPPVPATMQPANLTMFIVARWTSVTAFACMFNATNTINWQDGFGFGKTSPGLGVLGRTIASWVNQYNGVAVVQSPILNLNQWYVFEMWYTGAMLFQNINGVLSGSVAFAGPITYNPAAQIGLGAGKLGAGTFAFYWDGDVAAYALDGTVGAMSALQRSQARQYLGAKYGIPVVV